MTAQHPQGQPAGDAPDVDVSLESPEADAAEQRAELTDDSDDWPRGEPLGSADVPEADAVEQRQTVEGDEDEYR